VLWPSEPVIPPSLLCRCGFAGGERRSVCQYAVQHPVSVKQVAARNLQ
jgi:hypothetical protein